MCLSICMQLIKRLQFPRCGMPLDRVMFDIANNDK